MSWTRRQIVNLIEKDDRAVNNGILQLYSFQTDDEKSENRTKHLNNMGFNCADAKYGTYLARWIKSGRRLSGKHLQEARALCIKYSRQLTEIANNNIA